MRQKEWQKTKGIFEVALQHRTEERQNFLGKVCANDKSLLSEVKSLLSSLDEDKSFMETPAISEVAEIIFEENGKLAIGQNLGHYKILSQLGVGGMGVVYLAKDMKLKRRVALKVFQNKAFSSEKLDQFLLREAQMSATLEHPNICAVHEVFESNDCSFIVMQYLEGKTLAEKLQTGKLGIKKSVDLAIQIADAIDEAHTHQIIHRDIKPANIIVNDKGQAKILDFGLAKFVEAEIEDKSSRNSLIMGTAPYMSPEQARGESLDTRTDIFSFGVLFYEMLSGISPFAKANNSETISAILKNDPSFSIFPPNLRKILQNSLAKDKNKRYQSIKDLLEDLRSLPPNQEFDDLTPTKISHLQNADTEIIPKIELDSVKIRQPQTRRILRNYHLSLVDFTVGLVLSLWLKVKCLVVD